MSYLYGDSTPSTLETDYIEFLRDTVDCCVQVLLADQRIASGKARLEALEKSTAAGVDEIHKAAALVPKAFEGAALGEPESPAARCAGAILRSAAALSATAVAEVKAALDAEVGRAASEATQERQTCADALGRLLVKHDLPGMKSEIQIVFVGAGHYVGRAQVSTGFGVSGILELEIPKDHLFERIVRIDRLMERLAVQAPELGGWLHKEIKLRPQHLEKHHLAGLSLGAGGDTLRLRSGPDGNGAGFDLTFAPAGGPVRLVRVNEENKPDAPPFDVDAADVPKLQVLRDKLIMAAKTVTQHRRGLAEPKLDGEPLRSHPTPALLAERLVVAIAPTVQVIASRSQSSGELVLRRLIGEARREEIFLSKQELKNKLLPLGDRNRALFDPLWVVPPPGALPPPEPAKAETADPGDTTVTTKMTAEPAEAAEAAALASPAAAAVPPPTPPHLDLHPEEVIELLDSAPAIILDRASANSSTSDVVEISLIEERPSS